MWPVDQDVRVGPAQHVRWRLGLAAPRLEAAHRQAPLLGWRPRLLVGVAEIRAITPPLDILALAEARHQDALKAWNASVWLAHRLHDIPETVGAVLLDTKNDLERAHRVCRQLELEMAA